MLLDIIFLVVGLALILVGANLLTDGASAIAKRWGVSDMIVGLTVVAFGTSAPELVISIVSAINGSGELAIGNAVGSNIFNILAIVGVTAMVKPIKVERTTLTADIPLVVLSALVLLAMGMGPWLGDDTGRTLWRSNGIVLLLFFAIFMRYTFSIAKAAPSHSEPEPRQETSQLEVPVPMWKACGMIVLGLAALVWGGDIFVDSASSLARAMGVSDAVIGLTIVAAGTSLPELATSVVAATKGRPGLAVGNVIGSCLFNIFFVLGLSAVIRPLPLGSIGNLDLLVMTGAALLFWLFGWIIRHRTITRIEGIILVLLYIAYTIVLIVNA